MSLMALQVLDVSDTQVTDLTALMRATGLEKLYIGDSQVSDAQKKKLRTQLPNLSILHQAFP